ncbi:MAG TPA: hypothetical protein VHQ46_03635 [Desulfobacteria bacterium]|nr:hypothetical protein [Desulfobacteria bacterium]
MPKDNQRIQAHNWPLYLAGFSALLVGLLNLNIGYGLEDIIIHMFLAFMAMYLLTHGSLYLFKKFGIDVPTWDEFEQSRGSTLNALVDDDFNVEQSSSTADGSGETAKAVNDLPGQIGKNLSAGLSDDKQRAELKQRLGIK